jgi:hypothetical protein
MKRDFKGSMRKFIKQQIRETMIVLLNMKYMAKRKDNDSVLLNAEDLETEDTMNLVTRQNKRNVRKFLKHREKCNFSSDNSSVHWSSEPDTSESEES